MEASHLQSQFSEMAVLPLVLLEDHFIFLGSTYLKYLCLLFCCCCCFSVGKICSMVALLYFDTIPSGSTFESEVRNSLSALEPHSMDSLGHQHCAKN